MTLRPGGGNEDRPGLGVDSTGGAVVDPTKNVLDLVNAESKYQNGMRDAMKELLTTKVDALDKFNAATLAAESKIQNWMRDTEAGRVKDREDLKQVYETRIADMLRTSVESTSTLVSSQLVQIQNTFNERISQLERFRYDLGGRTSVSDPAVSDALAKMASAIAALQTTGATHEGRGTGRGEIIAWIISAILVATTLSPLLGTLLRPAPIVAPAMHP